MLKDKSISIIGAGRLGLTFGLLCEESGYNVCAYEINKERVKQITNKTLKTSEPKVEQLLKDSKIKMVDSIQECLEHSDLIFVLVATPSLPDGSYNHSSIDSIIKEIEIIQSLNKKRYSDKTVIISATVMPQYCQSLQLRLPTLNIAYLPFFIAQGTIYENIKNADIVLLGGRHYSNLMNLIKDIMDKEPNFKLMSSTAAEITKISLNCFLTTKISFANSIGQICINSDIENEVDVVLSAIGDDSRVGNKFLKYGFGYEGVCLPRDNRALALHAKNVGVNPIIQETVDTFNNNHYEFLRNKFIFDHTDKSIPIRLTQLSYKKGVDILTESQHYQLCKDLLEDGYIVEIEESDAVVDLVRDELVDWEHQVIYINQQKANG